MAVENIEQIEESLGIEKGKLTEMITSEENHTIDLTPLVIEKKAVYEERISNIKKEEFKHGQEKFFKTVRDSFGLDVTGKTPENLIDGLKSFVETEKEKGGAEPEEKYKTLKSDFEKLQGNLTAKETEFTNFKQTVEKEEEMKKTIKEQIQQLFPFILRKKYNALLYQYDDLSDRYYKKAHFHMSEIARLNKEIERLVKNAS